MAGTGQKRRSRPERARAARDPLAFDLSDSERRRRAKGYLRRYWWQGLSATEAQHAVIHHPDFAADPPSARAVQGWWAELVRGNAADLVDQEIIDAASHPLEDHRKAAIQRASADIVTWRTMLDALQARMADMDERGGDRGRAGIERRLVGVHKRLVAAEQHMARVVGYYTMPLEEQLSEAAGRARVIQALGRSWDVFEPGELGELAAGIQRELERRAIADEQGEDE